MTASEIDQLRRWKAEALPVLAGLQELGRALGIRLGEQITGRAAVDAALDLRNDVARYSSANREHIDRIDELEADVARLEDAVSTYNQTENDRLAAVVNAEIRAEDAEARTAAALARMRRLADEWEAATCITDGAPCSFHRHAAGYANDVRTETALAEESP